VWPRPTAVRHIVPPRCAMSDRPPANGVIAFTLVYFTFFLDNVLLTVLGPSLILYHQR
jgi:hypothetical protein